MSHIEGEPHATIMSSSTVQTQKIGERLGGLLRGGDLVCLEGDLGSGKTCLTQGIGRGLGITASIASPTFVLISEYHVPGKPYKLYHVDLYRLQSSAEMRVLGLEDYVLGDDICVVEWAERALEILPVERLWVRLEFVDDTHRSISLHATGPRYQALLDKFLHQGEPLCF